MAKKQQVSKTGNVVKVHYPTLNREVSLDVTTLPKEMQHQGLLHGIAQKLGDAASGKSPQEKYDMTQRIIAGLLEGQWELTATPVDLTPIICEAIARIKFPRDKQAAEKIQAAASEEQIKQWGGNAKVKAMILKIKAERAAAAAEEADDLEIEL